MQYKKFFIRLLLLAAILLPAMILLNNKYKKAAITNIGEKGIWIGSIHNQQYDFAVIGSSRAVYMADVLTMEKRLAMKGVNISIDGCAFAGNLAFLNLFLAHGNSINYLLIQVDEWGLIHPDSAYSYSFPDYAVLPYLDNDSVCSVLEEQRPLLKAWMWEYIPFTAYAEFSTKYPLDKVIGGFKDQSHWAEQKGSALLNGFYEGIDTSKAKSHERIFYSASFNYLKRIVSLCRSKGITPIFYTAPIYRPFLKYEPQNENLTQVLRNLAMDEKLTYLNFTSHPVCDSLVFFKDATHMNQKGALRFSNLFSDSLVNQLK
jgi:hypothetical protein